MKTGILVSYNCVLIKYQHKWPKYTVDMKNTSENFRFYMMPASYFSVYTEFNANRIFYKKATHRTIGI